MMRMLLGSLKLYKQLSLTIRFVYGDLGTALGVDSASR